MLGYHFTFVSRCNNCIAFTVLSEPIRGPVIKTTDNTLRLFASDTLANDISIVFTETPFTINEYVRPAALPSSKRFQLSVRPAAKTLVSGTILYWSHFDLNFSDWSRDGRRLQNHVHWKNLWLMVLEPTNHVTNSKRSKLLRPKAAINAIFEIGFFCLQKFRRLYAISKHAISVLFNIFNRFWSHRKRSFIERIEIYSGALSNWYLLTAALSQSEKGWRTSSQSASQIKNHQYENSLQINLRPPSFCDNLQRLNFDSEKFLCGVGRWVNSTIRRDSCYGDSGGPLVAKVFNERNEEKYTLVGIVSHGEGDFQNCGSFGAYTKVSKYLNFIQDPINNYWVTLCVF